MTFSGRTGTMISVAPSRSAYVMMSHFTPSDVEAERRESFPLAHTTVKRRLPALRHGLTGAQVPISLDA